MFETTLATICAEVVSRDYIEGDNFVSHRQMFNFMVTLLGTEKVDMLASVDFESETNNPEQMVMCSVMMYYAYLQMQCFQALIDKGFEMMVVNPRERAAYAEKWFLKLRERVQKEHGVNNVVDFVEH